MVLQGFYRVSRTRERGDEQLSPGSCQPFVVHAHCAHILANLMLLCFSQVLHHPLTDFALEEDTLCVGVRALRNGFATFLQQFGERRSRYALRVLGFPYCGRNVA